MHNIIMVRFPQSLKRVCALKLSCLLQEGDDFEVYMSSSVSDTVPSNVNYEHDDAVLDDMENTPSIANKVNALFNACNVASTPTPAAKFLLTPQTVYVTPTNFASAPSSPLLTSGAGMCPFCRIH